MAFDLELAETLVALALIMITLHAVVETAQSHPLGVIIGSETPQAYLGRRLGAFQPAMAAVADVCDAYDLYRLTP